MLRRVQLLGLQLAIRVRATSRSHWFHVPFLTGAAGLWLYWYFHPPMPNKAVLAIGVVAVVMTLTEMRPSHKAAWLVVVFALAFIENTAIDKERRDSDADHVKVRKEEHDSFQAIADGIQNAIHQSDVHFQATMQTLNSQIGYLNGITNEATGGDSYLIFGIGDTMGPFPINAPGVPNGDVLTYAMPSLIGKYPLHNIFVASFCQPLAGWLPNTDYGTMFPKEIGRPRQSISLLFPASADKATCTLFITTSNGSYSESVHFVKRNGKYLWAAHFYKYGARKPVRDFAAKGYPEDQRGMKSWY